MEEHRVQKNSKKIYLLVSFIFVFIIIFLVTIWIYFKPYIYVSLDVNPSMEFSVNKFGAVIKAQALNDEGQNILDELGMEIKYKNIEEALGIAVDKFIDEGYINSSSEVNVIVSAYSEDAKDADTLIKELKLMIMNKIESAGYVANIEGMTVDKNVFDEAESLGITPGKLDLINNIVENNNTPNNNNVIQETDKIENWIDKPVDEIVSASNQATQEEMEDGNQEDQEDEEDEEDDEDDEEDDEEDED